MLKPLFIFSLFTILFCNTCNTCNTCNAYELSGSGSGSESDDNSYSGSGYDSVNSGSGSINTNSNEDNDIDDKLLVKELRLRNKLFHHYKKEDRPVKMVSNNVNLKYGIEIKSLEQFDFVSKLLKKR